MAIDLTRDVGTSDKLKVPVNREDDSGVGRSLSMDANEYRGMDLIILMDS